jgi:hypothetical protein
VPLLHGAGGEAALRLLALDPETVKATLGESPSALTLLSVAWDVTAACAYVEKTRTSPPAGRALIHGQRLIDWLTLDEALPLIQRLVAPPGARK